jgi:hypothetical protein
MHENLSARRLQMEEDFLQISAMSERGHSHFRYQIINNDALKTK